MLVSAWLPYPRASHRMVRSAMTGWLDVMTVENSALSRPGNCFGVTVARASPASGTSCATVVPSPLRKVKVAVVAWPVALSSAISVSKKSLVAPSAKYRVKLPTSARKNGAT